jgi:hypothetical protein
MFHGMCHSSSSPAQRLSPRAAWFDRTCHRFHPPHRIGDVVVVVVGGGGVVGGVWWTMGTALVLDQFSLVVVDTVVVDTVVVDTVVVDTVVVGTWTGVGVISLLFFPRFHPQRS